MLFETDFFKKNVIGRKLHSFYMKTKNKCENKKLKKLSLSVIENHFHIATVITISESLI